METSSSVDRCGQEVAGKNRPVIFHLDAAVGVGDVGDRLVVSME